MGGGAGASQDFGRHQNWNFTSSIDPEELFRKIFGQAGFQRGGQFGDFNEDFAESRFGFGAAQEVRNLFTYDDFFPINLSFSYAADPNEFDFLPSSQRC